MRNKNTIYIMVGIAFILILSIGFALFSESLTISGTAVASGNFDIIYGCYTDGSEFNAVMNAAGFSNEIAGQKGYANVTCTPNPDDTSATGITYSVSLNYPGAYKYFVGKMYNAGTIDAVIQVSTMSHEICVDGGLASDGSATGAANGTIESSECQMVPQPNGFGDQRAYYRLFQTVTGSQLLKKTDNSYVNSSAFISQGITTTGTDIKLKAGETLYLVQYAGFSNSITRNPVLIRDTVTTVATVTQVTAN